MNWRSDISTADRFFGCLPYLIPIIEVFRYGMSLMDILPIFGQIYLFILPVMQIYYGVPMGAFAVFLLLYLLVVRNTSIHRFVRFNTLQAIMIDILISLSGLVLNYLITPILGGESVIIQVLSKVIFLGVWAMCLFSIFRTATGKYAEIPQLSENVHFYVDRM
jgi:Chloroplast import apparatus Tic20-like